MRGFFLRKWASLILLMGSILSLQAQMLDRSPRPTPDQLSLIDQIQGVGSFKFGASIDSFGKENLKSLDRTDLTPASQQIFQYVDPSRTTWGTLTPTEIELVFNFDQLVSIRLIFNQAVGDLIAVENAVVEKYGNSPNGTMINYYNHSSVNARQWEGAKIELLVSLPAQIPEGVDVNYLSQKQDGAVEISDIELMKKIAQDQLGIVQKALLKTQNLDKIKADL